VPCIAFGRPSCGRAFRCVAAPTLVRPYYKVCLQAKICSYLSSSSSFCLVLPYVDIFVVDAFFVWAPILRTRLLLRLGTQLADVPCVALGRPTCRRADVPCVCVVDVCWGAQLADVPCVALGRPTCGCALRCIADVRWGTQLAEVTCVALAPNLRTGLVLRLGAHLADVPCITLGRPTLVRPY
jgi:hypothetical protein